MELARQDGALRAHRAVSPSLLQAIGAAIVASAGSAPLPSAAALRLTGGRRPVTYDLCLDGGGTPGLVEAYNRLPPEHMRRGAVACISLDAWPPKRVVIETFVDGRRQGTNAASPAAVQVLGGKATEQHWIAGHDVTQSVARPASRLADASSWSGELGVLAMAGHDRLRGVVAAAEALGVAVAIHADGLSGTVFHSPGGGEPYRMLSRAEFKNMRSRTPEAPSGLLSIQGNAQGENWKAVRTIGGVLHGDTVELPAVCASRVGHRGTEVSEVLMDHGTRLASPDASPRIG